MIKVAVAGANGRMGRLTVDALKAADDLEYVGGFARIAEHGEHIYSDLHTLLHERKPDVVVDFTTYPGTVEVATACVTHGVAVVIGATGWSPGERETLSKLALEHGAGAMLVPNFAIGAVLMMRFAEQAARFFPSAEIVELHHDGKRDKPSGTARLTADRISAVKGVGTDVPIHSVRLLGLVAHQEVLLGNAGELLTIRHDSLSRESFVPGILFAIHAARERPGLRIGLDELIEQKLK